jgi:hypothetical protein
MNLPHRTFHYLAFSSLLLAGCTAFRELSTEELDQGLIPMESPIRVTRRDGSTIESGAFLHAFVRDSSDFIIGSGSERKSGRSFAGKVPRTEIDSSRQIVYTPPAGEQHVLLLFYLKNNTSLAFAEYEYLNVTPDLEPGLWFTGTLSDGVNTRLAKGRIDLSSVGKVEAKKFVAFNPSLPSSGKDSKQNFQWFDLGLGPLEVDLDGRGGRDVGSFLLQYSLFSQGSLYSVRLISTFDGLPIPVYHEGGGARSTLWELGALYGVSFTSTFLTASAALGLAYVGGASSAPLQAPPGYTRTKIGTVSLPIDLEVVLTPFPPLGIGLTYYSSFNSQKPFTGFAFCIQFRGVF